MFFLRVFSFIGGSFVLFAGPFLLLSDDASGKAGTGALLAGGIAVLLFALGYYFLAMAGHRTWRSQAIRLLAAGLLGFQLAAGTLLLATSHNAQVLVAAAPLMSLTVFLFMAFVWPGDGGRSHRPMRRRDPSPIH